MRQRRTESTAVPHIRNENQEAAGFIVYKTTSLLSESRSVLTIHKPFKTEKVCKSEHKSRKTRFYSPGIEQVGSVLTKNYKMLQILGLITTVVSGLKNLPINMHHLSI